MNQTLLVQTLFVPTRKMLEYQLKSLQSLYDYMQREELPADIYFTGFIEDEYKDELIMFIKKHFYKKCQVILFEKNYGKAHYVNEAVKIALEQNPNYQFLFTYDSDICFLEDETQIIGRLIDLFGILKYGYNNENPGLIACNFTGDNAHWIDKFTNTAILGSHDELFAKKEIIKWPSTPVGIAGGCLMISMEAWKKVGGYRVMGVYAPDDAMLMQDMARNGYFICVAETIKVHHPGTHDDPHYQNWKQKTSAYLMKSHDVAMAHCDSFWKQTKLQEEGIKKLELPNVTLIIADCLDVNRAIKAIEYSCREINFGKIKRLTSLETDYEHAVKIDKISSKEEYSAFCIYKLNDYVDTDYALVIQFDGFVIGGKKAWKNEFLECDYIGAPWNYMDTYNVGNGGFSLRSKKLLNILQNSIPFMDVHPEDFFIGRSARKFLEKRGIKFASEELAWQFAIECGHKHGWIYKGQFGFHGFDVINHNNIQL